MPPRPEPLPDGTIMFHAGFHKTGTTALQSAFASSRPQLLEAGVLYPGNRRSHHRAAMVVTKRTWGWEERGGQRTEPKYWGRVARAAAAHEGRVVISSEGFALADDAALDRIVDRLGAERLHAVFTLRPMSRLLASSWQQYLKYGLAMRYENWLKNVFAAPPECPPTPNFWRRNDHVGIMARWAERLGPDRVSLVVLDEGDRDYLFRTFEHLLALPSGLLVPDPELSASNRSMTAAEAEMLRQVNAGGAKRWDWPQYEKLVRRGAILRMVESRTPEPDEEPLGTPEWAIRAAQEVGARDRRAGRGPGHHRARGPRQPGRSHPGRRPADRRPAPAGARRRRGRPRRDLRGHGRQAGRARDRPVDQQARPARRPAAEHARGRRPAQAAPRGGPGVADGQAAALDPGGVPAVLGRPAQASAGRWGTWRAGRWLAARRARRLRYMASSARATRSAMRSVARSSRDPGADGDPCGHPGRVADRRSAPPLRGCSAIRAAAVASQEGSSRTNSSPPHRPTTSLRRTTVVATRATSRRAASPALCPWVSL